MAALPRHRRFLGGFVCGAAAGAAASCWAAWRLLRSQSQPEPAPERVLPEGKSRGLKGRGEPRLHSAARGGSCSASARPRSPQPPVPHSRSVPPWSCFFFWLFPPWSARRGQRRAEGCYIGGFRAENGVINAASRSQPSGA